MKVPWGGVWCVGTQTNMCTAHFCHCEMGTFNTRACANRATTKNRFQQCCGNKSKTVFYLFTCFRFKAPLIISRKWWSPCLLWQRTSHTAHTHTAWSGKTVQMASVSSTSIPTALVDTGIFLMTSMWYGTVWSAEYDRRVKMLFPDWVCFCFLALRIWASSVCGGRNLMPHFRRGGIRILIRLTVSCWMILQTECLCSEFSEYLWFLHSRF